MNSWQSFRNNDTYVELFPLQLDLKTVGAVSHLICAAMTVFFRIVFLKNLFTVFMSLFTHIHIVPENY